MAAPGEAREDSFCARCYAQVPPDAPYCPECGAPMGDAIIAGESAGHAELAQANVLRLRGDLAGSEKTLLALLRRFPNDPHAHEMLGDVCAERGELDRAAEWYELALDLAPNSTDLKRKLDDVRERQEGQEMADAAETLGLPSAKPAVVWWPLAASAAILVLSVFIVAWPRSAPPKALRATVVANGPVETTASTNDTTPTPATTPTNPPAATTGTEEDRKLLEAIQGRAGSVRVQTVTLDPRTGTLTVTFEVGATDDPKAVAIALGKEALGVATTATLASLRAVHADRPVLIADFPRTALNSADPLTNVWPTTTPGSEPSTTPTTTTGGASEPPATTEPTTTTGGTPTEPGTTGTTPPATTAGNGTG